MCLAVIVQDELNEIETFYVSQTVFFIGYWKNLKTEQLELKSVSEYLPLYSSARSSLPLSKGSTMRREELKMKLWIGRQWNVAGCADKCFREKTKQSLDDYLVGVDEIKEITRVIRDYVC